MALVPAAPLPMPVERLPPTPAFVTSGAWRQYVDDDHSVVALPLPASTYPDPLRWSAETGQDLRIARGYFLGPDDRPGRPDGPDRALLRAAATDQPVLRRDPPHGS